ncbi:MAG: hypothetical protein ABI367_12750 [Mucilaginibacter sp.]
MILNNVTTINDTQPVSIRVKPNKIERIDKSVDEEVHLNFTDAIILPGLVNAHDQLDFDLFPQLGSNIYNNYVEWGNYIHKNYKEAIYLL